MDKETKTKMDAAIELLSKAVDALNMALEEMVKISLLLKDKDQIRVSKAVGLVLDHLQSSINDARIGLPATPDLSREYTV
jgi:hypothetical protein